MNFKINETEKGKQVVFEDGYKSMVHTDEGGKEYFYVRNANPDAPLGTFVGHIKDAVQTIRDGHGDALQVRNLFGISESVVRFLDRAYGEEIRAKTLEGFKDTEFGYSLKFGYSDSFSGGAFVSKDKVNFVNIMDKDDTYVCFDTLEEANEFKEQTLKKAEELATQYNNESDRQSKLDFIDAHAGFTLLAELWVAIARKKEYYFKPVQVVKPVAVGVK